MQCIFVVGGYLNMVYISDKMLSPRDFGTIRTLLKDLADKWRVLGAALGFLKDKLDEISATPAESIVHLGRLLFKWLSGDADSPTVTVLVNALRRIEETADIIQNIIAGKRIWIKYLLYTYMINLYTQNMSL